MSECQEQFDYLKSLVLSRPDLREYRYVRLAVRYGMLFIEGSNDKEKWIVVEYKPYKDDQQA